LSKSVSFKLTKSFNTTVFFSYFLPQHFFLSRVDLVAATRFCLTPLLAELVAATFRRIPPAPTSDRIHPQVVQVQLGHPAIRPT